MAYHIERGSYRSVILQEHTLESDCSKTSITHTSSVFLQLGNIVHRPAILRLSLVFFKYDASVLGLPFLKMQQHFTNTKQSSKTLHFHQKIKLSCESCKTV
jgi:hypothetical protein